MNRSLPLLMSALLALPSMAADTGYVEVEGGRFRSSVKYEESVDAIDVATFEMMARPVSNAEFAAFVKQHPQWRRDRVPALLSGPGYLSNWQSADAPGDALEPDAPAVQVTWYAADAYCRQQGARLPTFLEWEYAASADATRPDARGDVRWRMQQLQDGTPHAIDAARDAAPNFHGLYQMHGAIWEWSEDFSSLMAGTDRRGDEDGDRTQFCGATALAFNDRDQYATVKRFAILSALRAGNTLGNLGFRCARSQP